MRKMRNVQKFILFGDKYSLIKIEHYELLSPFTVANLNKQTLLPKTGNRWTVLHLLSSCI